MITLSDLLAGTGGTLHGQAVASEFADFCYDSRILHPGELFLAVVTETGDGHDYIDDAIRGGFIDALSLPANVRRVLGDSHRERINTMVGDIIKNSAGITEIRVSPEVADAMSELREFMFAEVYLHPSKVEEEQQLSELLTQFYYYYLKHLDQLPPEYQRQPAADAVCDYIAGMTDSFALDTAARIL